jgi:predicted transcriptional regulator
MTHRSKQVIQAAILEAANGGATKTRLISSGRLDYYVLAAYLKELLEIGMIEYNAPEELYRTSTKGIYFLQVYRQMVELAEI